MDMTLILLGGLTFLLGLAIGLVILFLHKYCVANRELKRLSGNGAQGGQRNNENAALQRNVASQRIQRGNINPARANTPVNNRAQSAAPRRNITETGPMVYYANDRHHQRDKEYRFNYKKVGNGWRAYILRLPNLGGRAEDCAITHRLHDANGEYVCWDTELRNLHDAQVVSRRWADCIQEYIATGRRF